MVGIVILVLLFLLAIWIFVELAKLPGSKARERGHPQAEAINVLSWVGLLFGGVASVGVCELQRRDREGLPAGKAQAPAGHGRPAAAGCGPANGRRSPLATASSSTPSAMTDQILSTEGAASRHHRWMSATVRGSWSGAWRIRSSRAARAGSLSGRTEALLHDRHDLGPARAQRSHSPPIMLTDPKMGMTSAMVAPCRRMGSMVCMVAKQGEQFIGFHPSVDSHRRSGEGQQATR